MFVYIIIGEDSRYFFEAWTELTLDKVIDISKLTLNRPIKADLKKEQRKTWTKQNKPLRPKKSPALRAKKFSSKNIQRRH